MFTGYIKHYYFIPFTEVVKKASSFLTSELPPTFSTLVRNRLWCSATSLGFFETTSSRACRYEIGRWLTYQKSYPYHHHSLLDDAVLCGNIRRTTLPLAVRGMISMNSTPAVNHLCLENPSCMYFCSSSDVTFWPGFLTTYALGYSPSFLLRYVSTGGLLEGPHP